ncbi:MAG: hypothetical protein ACFFE6_11405, partial [Candidatus Thorarchaeota archaeon]
MESIAEKCGNWKSRKNRHHYVLNPDLSRPVSVLAAICVALLLFTPILRPSYEAYNSVGELRSPSGESSIKNNLQSNPIWANDQIYVLWDMVHGNQAQSQFSNLIAEIVSYGFITDTLSSGSINASTLQGYNILVIVQPTLSYSTNETDSIHDFVLGGGGLLV